MRKYILGIDEAGRGPLAGPVAVGCVRVPHDFDWSAILGVGDSKKLSPKNREAIFRRTKELQREGVLDYRVVLVSAKEIDRKGIAVVIRKGIEKALASLAPNPSSVHIKLDGSLKAPVHYVYQETIIKGDAKEKVIGLASILAKVTRDAYMVRIAKKYPEYGFEIHKGYGTKKHRELIQKHGVCVEYRNTFLTRIL